MKIARPKLPKVCQHTTNSSIFSNLDDPSHSWFPYPQPGKPQRTWFKELFLFECQLAEFIQDSQFFHFNAEPTLLLSHEYIYSVYQKLLRWRSNMSELFLPNYKLLPSIILLE